MKRSEENSAKSVSKTAECSASDCVAHDKDDVKIESEVQHRFMIIYDDIYRIGLDAYELAIYTRLVYRAGQNNQCWESPAKLAKATNMSKRKVIYTLKSLVSKKLIRKTLRKREDGSNTTTVYTILNIHSAPGAHPPVHQVHTPCASGAQQELDSNELNSDVTRERAATEVAAHSSEKKLDDSVEKNVETEKASDTSIASRTKDCSPKPHESSLAPNQKIKPKTAAGRTFSSEDLHLAQSWSEYAKENHPHIKHSQDKLQEWANDLRLTREYLGCAPGQLSGIFEYIKYSTFWRGSCQSPKSLRNNAKNGMKKIDNIMSQMKEDRKIFDHLKKQILG